MRGEAPIREVNRALSLDLPEGEDYTTVAGLCIALAGAVPERGAHLPAATLTLSGQKRLEIARAIATGARVVLLDEVMAGLTPTEVGEMLQTLRYLHAGRGLTLVVIEHVMRALMELCGRIVVLHLGAAIAEGTPEEIAANPQVLSVYFGGHA